MMQIVIQVRLLATLPVKCVSVSDPHNVFGGVVSGMIFYFKPLRVV